MGVLLHLVVVEFLEKNSSVSVREKDPRVRESKIEVVCAYGGTCI